MSGTWKLVVRTWKSKPTTVGRAAVEKTILEEAGAPLKLREARRCLLLLTTQASRSRPVILEGEGGLVCLIALDDVVEIVMDPSPTLAEVIEKARRSSDGERI